MNGKLIKTIWKRAEMVVLALALAVFSLLTACRRNKENNTVSDKQVKQGVFRKRKKRSSVGCHCG